MTPRAQLADELLRRFAASVRSAQLYSKGHPIIVRNMAALSAAVQPLHALEPAIVIGIVGDEIIVDDTPISKAENLGGVSRRLKLLGVERVTIDRGVTAEEIATFVEAVTTLELRPDGESAGVPHAAAHPRRARDRPAESRGLGRHGGVQAAVHRSGVGRPNRCGRARGPKGSLTPTVARTMVDGLAQAVSQNRTALLALTTLKNYDNYTFTHMVNVSILTMGQARALGIDGSLLREFGLAALMHDIGKVRTPLEVLNKPDKLTDAEFTHHEASHRGRRGDPPRHARHSGAGAGRGLRAPPAD